MVHKEIRIKSFEELHPFFQLTGMPMIHCAVQRGFPIYRHDYIVLGHTWHEDFKTCYIIRAYSVDERGKGTVKQELYSKEQFEDDIKEGLYMYHDDEYPKNDDDYFKAHDRFLEGWGEIDNSILLKNSGHLVHYILTGLSGSHQLRKGLIDLFTDDRYKALCRYVFRFWSLTTVDL